MLLAALSLVQVVERAGATVGPIDNGEQRVSEHGFRFGAEQFAPDVGGNFLVWQDHRGNNAGPTTNPNGRIWSKNLTTRDEAPVTTLSTQAANPRVAVTGVAVWTDFTFGNDDIFSRQLPSGTVLPVTTNVARQTNPAIDGTTVVWEDYRNGDVDIYMRNLAGGPETAIVTAPGNQTSPSVSVSSSGNTTTTAVAWRDARDGPGEADVWVWVQTVTGNSAPKIKTGKIVDANGTAASFSVHQVAVSAATSRLLWNEIDPGCSLAGGTDCAAPKLLKTCVFTIGSGQNAVPTCGPVSLRDRVASGPSVGGAISDLDLSGNRGSWVRNQQIDNGFHVFSVDLSTSAYSTQVDRVTGFGGVAGARIDGQRLAWTEMDNSPPPVNAGGIGQPPGDQAGDIFWDDLTTPEAPRRANSINLGPFGQNLNPVADGDLVAYRAPGGIHTGSTEWQVWATDLSGTRRHFPVSTVLSSDTSRPAIGSAGRVVWSECATQESRCTTNAFQRTVPAGEQNLFNAGPPDADVSKTAWGCGTGVTGDFQPGALAQGPAAICVRDGSSVTMFPLTLIGPGSVIGSEVRISGDHVGWYETDPGPPFKAELHVLDISTNEDEIVGKGGDVVGGFADFEISGSDIVWSAGGDTIWRNTTGCSPDPSPCDHSGNKTAFETVAGHYLHSPSIGGGRVAWVDCAFPGEGPFCGTPDDDIYTATIADSTSHLVTNESTAFVDTPFVDPGGDRIYWVDQRDGGQDVYGESVSGSMPPADLVAPGPPGGFVATTAADGVRLAWQNPSAPDFFRVRILRKSGTSPPSSLDDTSASVVYEGPGTDLGSGPPGPGDFTSFTDTDVAQGTRYSYAIVAFDLQPNYSTAATATSP